MKESKIETESEYENTPTGQADYWEVEMAASKEELEKFHSRGDKVIKRFVGQSTKELGDPTKDYKVNLFTANVQTLRSMLYGKTPNVDVKRKYADPGDDIARLAGEMLQRLLNTDIERDSDSYAEALEMALDDRLLPGLGCVRLRYEAEFEDQEEVPAQMGPCPTCQGGSSSGCKDCGETGEVEKAPSYTPESIKVRNDRGIPEEEVATDYVHWKDFRWSPARYWSEVRWVAFRVLMSKDDLIKRFGEEVGSKVPLSSKGVDKDQEDNENDPWARAEVWEIWHKSKKQVVWWVKGHNELLDSKDDPFGLEGFWPCPRPMFANLTTSKMVPVPDYVLAEDLYNEIDEVTCRIVLLEEAVAVRGVYDKNSEEIKFLLKSTKTNDMIASENFAVFKEKGGLAGVVDFLPLEMIVGALDKLREYRAELINLMFQVTGFSDIMRGQSAAGTTATTDALKAKFASVRMQAFQAEFARFASDAQSIKAEIISMHFDPETILARANVRYMGPEDQQAAIQAVELIKSDLYQYRIEVKPEAISMADHTAVKQERTEFLTGMATFLQSAFPMMQAAPWATPFLLQTLQWAAAGFRSGSTIEGVLDQAVTAAQQQMKLQAQQPPKPDPEMVKAQMEMKQMEAQGQMDMRKAQMDLQAMQMKLQADMMKMKMELQGKQAGLQLDAEKQKMDLQSKQASHQLDAEKQKMDGEQAVREHVLTARQMENQAKADAIKSAEQVTKKEV